MHFHAPECESVKSFTPLGVGVIVTSLIMASVLFGCGGGFWAGLVVVFGCSVWCDRASDRLPGYSTHHSTPTAGTDFSPQMFHDCVEKRRHFAKCHVTTICETPCHDDLDMVTGIDHLAAEAPEFDDGTMTGIDYLFISWIPSPLALPTRATPIRATG